MNKRIISIILCLTLCACFLILPAAATSIDNGGVNDAGTQYLNYLVNDKYSIYNDTWGTNDDPSYDYTDTLRFGFKWTPENLVPGSYMLFAIQASRRPDLVNVRFSSSDSYVAATYEGAIPSAGNFYFYRISMPSKPINIEIFGRFNNSYSGNITLGSCFGVRNLLSVYDRAQFTYMPIYDGPEGESVGSLVNDGTQFFPYTMRLDTTNDLNRVDFTIRCDGDRFNTSAVGKCSLLLTSYCNTYRVTASLVAKDSNVREVKNIKVNLSKDDNWGLVNNYEVGAGNIYNYAAYQVDFDLTGYDMAYYDLMLYVSIDSVLYVNASSVSNPRLLEVTFRSFQYVPTILSNPWYKPITDAFAAGWSSVTSALSNLMGNMRSWFSTLGSRFETAINGLKVSLDNTLNELLGFDSSQQENIDSSVDQNQQTQEEVTDKSDELISDLEEIEDQEDEMLTVPEINQDDLALGTLIPQSGLTLMNNVMVTITSNERVSQMIVLVLSVAVVGVLIL